MILDPKSPEGPVEKQWNKHRFDMKLVNPANKRKYDIIVVGSGLAGASASATLGELGYNVQCFAFQDSPRRAHSIAAQGGINSAKNYQNDGDSVYRLFYDTIKGGDYRSRESNVYRLAEVSLNIIDQCVAQGIPFAREYGGLLDNRSFGGTQLSRTFYARGQTGQQLLLGAYQALNRQIAAGKVKMHSRSEMLELILVDGHAKGIIVRNLITGEITSHSAHAVVIASGGYGNIFNLSTNAKGSNITAAFRAYKKGALFANPSFTQIHPTCIPVSGDYQSKLTLMSESLRNDGRIWVPKNKEDVKKRATDIPEKERDYFLERRYPSFGNLVPRDIASRAVKAACDEGNGVSPTGKGVYLDFSHAIQRLGKEYINDHYGNLFQMYDTITGDNPYETPMMIYPAVHYTMGGLWVDYNLMSNIPGLFVLGEANFADHGANRLGASALMQGLADGYFVIPATISHYLAQQPWDKISSEKSEFKQGEKDTAERLKKLTGINGKKTPTHFHKELGLILWDNCGMSRNESGLKKALEKIPKLREEFWKDLRIPSNQNDFNQSLELAGRVADFLEFGEVMCNDALERKESCGAHFREEYQTEEGEAKRDDENFQYVAAWKHRGTGEKPELHKEELKYEFIHIAQRSYK